MMKNTSKSKCKVCGERILETGNYTMQILKAKRIPEKSRKMLESKESAEQTARLSLTKFGRFLLKRSVPRNTIEIKCSTCSGVSLIGMKKPLKRRDSEASKDASFRETPSSSVSIESSKKRRKRNRTKDLSAGLVIPPSLQNSPSTLHSFSSNSMKSDSKKGVLNSQTTKHKNAALDKQKQLDNLRKTLFKSDSKRSNEKGRTLKDFLASM